MRRVTTTDTTPTDNPLVARLRYATAEVRRAEQALEEARQRRDAIIVEGIAEGTSRNVIALATGLTPTRITHIVAA